jgi:hypothetical protein
MILLTIAPFAACDKFMRLDIHVADAAGVPVGGAIVRATIATDGREVMRNATVADGSLTDGTTYGFRSGARALVISKDNYRPFTTGLDPRAAYACHIVLRSATDPEPSSGKCEAQ